jgi:hypothetical protein
MFSVSESVPVNKDNETRLTRLDVWHGLELKARNALPFIPAMTHCLVLREESVNVFFREIIFKGDRAMQRVTLDPLRSVTFERLTGKSVGVIRNIIEVDERGALSLRFTFELELPGVPAGSEEEAAYANEMRGEYVSALNATIGAIRQLKMQGAERSNVPGL